MSNEELVGVVVGFNESTRKIIKRRGPNLARCSVANINGVDFNRMTTVCIIDLDVRFAKDSEKVIVLTSYTGMTSSPQWLVTLMAIHSLPGA